MSALFLKEISFCYDDGKTILDGINLLIDKGSVVSITGKSGSGKTTLAMIMCGVIPKAISGRLTGSVHVFGEDISGREIYETSDIISMVFQDPESQLFAPTIEDEVAFAPENLCFSEQTINLKIKQAVDSVGLSESVGLSPGSLSGGQQQLAALSSILSLNPKIIIFDEVASFVDDEGKALIFEAIKNLKMQGKTIVIIDHDRNFETLYDLEYELRDGKLYPVNSHE